MDNYTYRGCQIAGIGIVFIAFVVGVQISNPPQNVSPQDGAVSAVDSKVAPNNTPDAVPPSQPQSPEQRQLNSQARFIMAYERRGGDRKMVIAQLSAKGKELTVTPIPQSSELEVLGKGMATIGLVPMNEKGKFQWLTLNLRENNYFLFQVRSDLSVAGMELKVSGARDIAMEGEKILATTGDKLVTIEDGRKPMYQPLPGGGSLTRMKQTYHKGKFLGTCFTQIGANPIHGNFVFFKPSARKDLMVTPVYIFPQSFSSQGDHIYIFGLDKNRRCKMLDLKVSDTDGEMKTSLQLKMKNPPNSIGVGHAFVHPFPNSPDLQVTLFFWDDPYLRRFNARTGAELMHTSLMMHTAGEGTNHEIRQSTKLSHKDRYCAVTMQSTNTQGQPMATIMVGRGNSWKIMSILGTTNGLTANGRWLAWDVRNTQNGADQVLFLDLDGEMNKFGGSLVLGKSNPGTEMPSFLAINTR